MPWRNRFAQTAREKVDTSFRHRARERLSNALVVFMPIAAPFDQTRIEVLCEGDPILLNGTALAGRIPDADIPKDGIWFKQFYFHAVADGPAGEVLCVPAGGRAGSGNLVACTPQQSRRGDHRQADEGCGIGRFDGIEQSDAKPF